MTASVLNNYQNGVGNISGPQANSFVQNAQSVTQLRAFVGTTPIVVFLEGYVAPADGGQGNFYWNASAVSPVDDNGVTTIVPPAAGQGCWSRISTGVSGGVTSFNTRTGAVTLTSGDVTGALGYTPGTVTSLSTGNLSPLFNASVSNPTTTPALSFTAINQNAGLFYASPASSAGAPSFRNINTSDLPAGATTVDPGFVNFVISPIAAPFVAPAVPASGLIASLPAGNAVLNNVIVPIPAVIATFTDASITDYYLNAAGAGSPWTIVVTPLATSTAAIRYPALVHVWTVQTSGGNITGINMMSRTRPVWPRTTDVAKVVDQVTEFYQINVTRAWVSGANISYGEIVSTTDGNLYQSFTQPSSVLGSSKPTGTATGTQTNGGTQLGYYGQTSYEGNFRYALSSGIQSYFSTTMAGLIANLQGTSGTQMSSVVKTYLISQFKHCVTVRQNSAAYTYGQKVIVGGYIWLNTTVAGGTTHSSSPFSGSYTPGTSTVVDGTITWLCIYISYGSPAQEYYWMETDRTMLIYQPSDAHDSDASELFIALANYIYNTWDFMWLLGASPIPNKTYLQVMQSIYDNNLSTLSNALTQTFQQQINPFTGASFTQQYLEDNCESYSGFIAAGYIFNLLGDLTRGGPAGEAVYGASLVNSGIFGLLNVTSNVWGWFYGDPMAWIGNPTLAWYPWYQAQFFPELHQIPSADNDAKQGARGYIMNYWNNWPEDPGTTAGLPWITGAYIAAKYWQDIEKAQAMVDIVETIFLSNGLIASDFGYYLQTKHLLVDNFRLQNINGVKVTTVDAAGNNYTTNAERPVSGAGGDTIQMYYGDYLLDVTASGALTVELPIRSTLFDQYPVVIKDFGGTSGTDTITIAADTISPAGSIDGSSTTTIASNYGVKKFVYNLTSNNWFSTL